MLIASSDLKRPHTSNPAQRRVLSPCLSGSVFDRCGSHDLIYISIYLRASTSNGTMQKRLSLSFLFWHQTRQLQRYYKLCCCMKFAWLCFENSHRVSIRERAIIDVVWLQRCGQTASPRGKFGY